MTGFMLDTGVVSLLLDPTHQEHNWMIGHLESIVGGSPSFISAIAYAELAFGAEIAMHLEGQPVPSFAERQARAAREYVVLDVTDRDAPIYARLKRALAVRHMPTVLRRRSKYVERWESEITGDRLGVQEADLWMCAQCKERGLAFLTLDGAMQRIKEADPDVQLHIVPRLQTRSTPARPSARRTTSVNKLRLDLRAAVRREIIEWRLSAVDVAERMRIGENRVKVLIGSAESDLGLDVLAELADRAGLLLTLRIVHKPEQLSLNDSV